jgi:thiol peroxidase
MTAPKVSLALAAAILAAAAGPLACGCGECDEHAHSKEGHTMNERTGLVTMKGDPVTLLGNEVGEGDTAPDFTVVGADLQPVTLENLDARILVLASVPSLDTSVCSTETRRFNEEAAGLGDDVQVVTISVDLPFAQQRWCGAHGIERVRTLSDHRDVSFGKAYGVLMKDVRLLARAVFVVDADRVVRHAQIVPEVTEEPDYQAVLDAVTALK